jgi:uncharacterized membrane protein (DUF373 family)
MKKDLIITKTEDWVYLILSLLAICFIIFETIDLIYIFYVEVSRFTFASERPLGLTGVPIFFNILITLEILETFKNHHATILSKVKIILLIGITAIVRKMITFDIKHSDHLMLIGIAILIVAFCVGYFMLAQRTNAEE